MSLSLTISVSASGTGIDASIVNSDDALCAEVIVSFSLAKSRHEKIKKGSQVQRKKSIMI
jgi:hypothetical protein